MPSPGTMMLQDSLLPRCSAVGKVSREFPTLRRRLWRNERSSDFYNSFSFVVSTWWIKEKFISRQTRWDLPQQ